MIYLLLSAGAIILLIVVQAFFSGSEIALINCDKTRLMHKAKKGQHGAALALRMFEKPEVILTTTLIGTNVALVGSSVLTTTLMIGLFGNIGGVIAVFVLTPLTLMFGEVIPKSVFQQMSDKLAPRIIYPLYVLSLLFFPVVFVFAGIARLVARLVGTSKPGAAMFAVREQLRAVLESAESASPDHPFDRLRIRNVVRFGELVASDLMIPAADMKAIAVTDDLADALTLVRETGLTYVPAYEGERSNVVGMAHLTAWALVDPELQARGIAGLTNPALFVSSLQPAAELLPVLRARDDESAIVVDEYGSTVGLINVRMILESVVGKLSTATPGDATYGSQQAAVEDLGDDTYRIDARMPIAEVNDLLATEISTATAHSIGGLLVMRLRRVPKVGDSITEGGFEFTVEEATERAAVRLRASRE